MNIDKIENGFLVYTENADNTKVKYAFNTWEMTLEFLKDNPATAERDFW